MFKTCTQLTEKVPEKCTVLRVRRLGIKRSVIFGWIYAFKKKAPQTSSNLCLVENATLDFTSWMERTSCIVKTTSKNNEFGEITWPVFKPDSQATAIKTVCYHQQRRHINQFGENTASRETHTHIDEKTDLLISEKQFKGKSVEKR